MRPSRRAGHRKKKLRSGATSGYGRYVNAPRGARGGLIAIAHGLGLEVTAEGVETEEQLAYLRSQGCRRAQGYLLAKPTPAEELQALPDAAPWESLIE